MLHINNGKSAKNKFRPVTVHMVNLKNIGDNENAKTTIKIKRSSFLISFAIT
jgi:hypothetical protein